MKFVNTYWLQKEAKDKDHTLILPFFMSTNITTAFDLIEQGDFLQSYEHTYAGCHKYVKLLKEFKRSSAYEYLNRYSEHFVTNDPYYKSPLHFLCSCIRIGFTGHWYREGHGIWQDYFPALSIKVWEGSHHISFIGRTNDLYKTGKSGRLVLPLSDIYPSRELCKQFEIRRALATIAMLNDAQ